MKIKFHLFLFVISFLSIGLTANSQTYDTSFEKNKNQIKNKKIELIIGPSLLYPIGTFNNENNPRRVMMGYSIGVGFQKLQSNRFEIMFRLLYERKGYKTEYINIDSIGNRSNVYNTQNLNYLSFNLLPSIFLNKGKKSKLIAGAYFSLLTHDAFKQKVFLNGQYSFSYSASNVNGRFDTYDYGISFGVCQTKGISEKIDIGLQLLGNFGLNNIVPNKFTGVHIKNSSLSLSVIFTYKH